MLYAVMHSYRTVFVFLTTAILDDITFDILMLKILNLTALSTNTIFQCNDAHLADGNLKLFSLNQEVSF